VKVKHRVSRGRTKAGLKGPRKKSRAERKRGGARKRGLISGKGSEEFMMIKRETRERENESWINGELPEGRPTSR